MRKSTNRNQETDRLLTPKRAAELLCVTAQTVKKYIYTGRLPSVTTPGGHHRVRESDVRALLRPNEFAGDSDPVGAEPDREVIRCLVAIIEEMCDTFTPGHGERVAAHARSLARKEKMPPEQQDEVWLGALLHDVGKLKVDSRVLRKEGRLTRSEFQQVKQHPIYGGEILGNARDLAGVTDMIRHHHERPDGAGYPDGLGHDEIPRGAKIIAIAEAYDSMCSQVPYRKPLSREQAVAEVLAGGGTSFDASLADSFAELMT